MPVSTQGAGSLVTLPSSAMSNCMNTWFQISMKRSPSSSGDRAGRPGCGAVVVEDLAARGRRAGVGHHPEVVALVLAALVVADADHALGGRPITFVQMS
jgi:hypothetical protein